MPGTDLLQFHGLELLSFNYIVKCIQYYGNTGEEDIKWSEISLKEVLLALS